jgi:integrase
MARTTELLTAIKVKNAKAKGLYPDGAGLYLKVTETGSKSWVYRYKRAGKVRDMGLGNADADKVGSVSLAQARRLAGEARQKLLDGVDPLDERKAEAIVAQETEDAEKGEGKGKATTFKAVAEEFIRAKEAGWSNLKHRDQWRATLAGFAYPLIGHLSVAEVDTSHVLQVLQQPMPVERRGKKGAGSPMAPLWQARAETATRLRARVEAVLSAAKAMRLREGENPARWADHLEHFLPPQPKSKRLKHHPALPYGELPEFMARLRENTSISARALEFVILTSARTGEVLNAAFPEFDLEAKVWIVPAKRMKGGKEHKVPLTPRAVEIVNGMAKVKLSDFVFPGLKSKRPLSDMALTMLTRGMRPGITNHGFRSAFKDWAIECTDFPDFLSEAALAHVSADKVRGAYARTDLFARRRRLMQDWADFCDGTLKLVVGDDDVPRLVRSGQPALAA